MTTTDDLSDPPPGVILPLWTVVIMLRLGAVSSDGGTLKGYRFILP